MKILAIGDIHGKTIWRQLIEKVSVDTIVFVGDFVTVRQWMLHSTMRANLLSIIDLKKRNPESVKLLIGNHDIPFISRNVTIPKILSPLLWRAYRNNAHCFQMAYQHDKLLFTHAGLSKGWLAAHRDILKNSDGSLVNQLNELPFSRDGAILKERGEERGGKFKYGSILYADKAETECGAIEGYTQIVGHTKVNYPIRSKADGGEVIYIDCLNSTDSALFIDDGTFMVISADGLMRQLA